MTGSIVTYQGYSCLVLAVNRAAGTVLLCGPRGREMWVPMSGMTR